MTAIYPTTIPIVMEIRLHTRNDTYGSGGVTVFTTEAYLLGVRQYGVSADTEDEAKSKVIRWVHENYTVPDNYTVYNKIPQA